jgi:hypothetical protein
MPLHRDYLKGLAILVLLVGCGRDREDAQQASRPTSASPVVSQAAPDTTASDDDTGKRIADEITKLRDNWLVYLHDLGWIQLHDKYAGVRAVWTSSPKLVAELNHQPEPKPPAAWRDERGRYMAAIHDGDQNPKGEDPNLDVVSLYWSADFVDRVHRELVDKLAASIPHVGRFSIQRDAAGAHVVFEASAELVQRISRK